MKDVLLCLYGLSIFYLSISRKQDGGVSFLAAYPTSSYSSPVM